MGAEHGITRRGILGRIALLVGGAAAGTAAGAGVAVQATGSKAAPAEAAGTQKLVLRVNDLRSHVPASVPGKLPKLGWTSLPTGQLVGERDEQIGRFHASLLPGVGGSLLQTFELPGGTILGIGGQLLDGGTYAIVGGTGKYLGASGSYVARQSSAGAKRTAEFDMTLKAWEA
ncbi:MAG: hypothetical protein M3R12_01735 [Actinomycetota bacterium]|nr:hypothetical protein [Actinomycetota bacterium]